MQLTLTEKIAIRNTGRFVSLANAVHARNNQKYFTNILFGNDGRFWVAANHREESILIRLYSLEVVSKETLSVGIA